MRNLPKLYAIIISIGLLTVGLPACNIAPTPEVVDENGDGLAVSREPALPGKPITPTDFPADLLPGIENPGVIPEKKSFVVYSNGDMGNTWRLNHVQDFEVYGNAYSERFGIRFLWTNSGDNSDR